MANIIGRQETLLQMFPGETLGTITNGVAKAVSLSFEEQHMKNPTRQEIRTRFEICIKWAKVLRGDLKWGVQRIADEMVNVLRAELCGQRYQPPKREVWVPTDGLA